MLSSCSAVVSVSEFDDAKTVGKGVLKTSFAVENAEIYYYNLKEREKFGENIIIVSGKATYGITDSIDFSYSTWNGGVPIVSSSLSVKYYLSSYYNINTALKFGAVYAPLIVEDSQTDTEEEKTSGYFYGFAFSFPMNIYCYSSSVYWSPRFLYTQFNQRYLYHRYSNTSPKTTIETKDILNAEQGFKFGFSTGVSIPTSILTVNPEFTLIQRNKQFIPHWGVRFGL